MRPRAVVFNATLVLLLVLAPALCLAQGTHSTAHLEVSKSKFSIQKGSNQTMHVSIYSAVDQYLVLTLTTAYEHYFNLSRDIFYVPIGEYVYTQVQISIPDDTPEITLRPVLNLYHYFPEQGNMSVDPVFTLSFTIDVVSGDSGKDAADYLLPFLLILFGILEIGGIIFLIWTRQRKYKDFKIRDVFLIYKDGRLIKHLATHSEESLDHFTVSSMLTAISNYINDSFRSEKTGARYGELQHGDLRVLVEHGDNVDLAVVVSGEYPPKLKRIMSNTLDDIENTYSLKKWDGDYGLFVNLTEVIRPLILMQRDKNPSRFAKGRAKRDEETALALIEERDRRLDEMAKRIVASGAVPKEALGELRAHLMSLDDSQLGSFDTLMDHLTVDEDGNKVHYIEVPVPEKNLDR